MTAGASAAGTPDAPPRRGEVDRLVVGAGLFGLYGALPAGTARPSRGAARRRRRADAARQPGQPGPGAQRLPLPAQPDDGAVVGEVLRQVHARLRRLHQHALRPDLRDRPGAVVHQRRRLRAVLPSSRGPLRRDSTPSQWFAPGTVDAAYQTEEYSFDAARLRAASCARAGRPSVGALVLAGADGRRGPGRRRLHRPPAGRPASCGPPGCSTRRTPARTRCLRLLGDEPLSAQVRALRDHPDRRGTEPRRRRADRHGRRVLLADALRPVRAPLPHRGRLHPAPQPATMSRRTSSARQRNPRLQRRRPGQLLVLPAGAGDRVAVHLRNSRGDTSGGRTTCATSSRCTRSRPC